MVLFRLWRFTRSPWEYVVRIVALVLAALGTVAAASPAPAPEPAVTVSHAVVRSFDGTPIYTTLFLPAGADTNNPVPLILRSHGWGGHGERDMSEASSTTRALLGNGYGVFTWDERGFGYSGGEVHVLKPESEGRDASALIDYIATNPAIAPVIACDTNRSPGGRCADPVLGMTGESYGGGIQLLTAAFDGQYSTTTSSSRSRVNAIAPEITWNDLRYSLDANNVLNLGWSELLYGAGLATAQAEGLDPRNPAGPQSGGLDPRLHQAQAEGLATNHISAESNNFLGDSSFAVYGKQHPVSVPALFMQGSVDTLFDLSEGVRNFQAVRRNAPARLIAFCGGHVSCPKDYADAGDRQFLDNNILNWFDKYLKHRDVSTGSPVVYRTNEGIWRGASTFPPAPTRPRSASGHGSIISTPLPTTVRPGSTGFGDGPLTTAAVNPPGDPHAFSFEVADATPGKMELVGQPSAELTVSGTGPEAHVFAKLVDREAGTVVNLQEATQEITNLTATPQRITIAMPAIAYTLPRGHHLDFQLSTTSLMDAPSRTPAQLTVSVDARVPVQ